MAWRGTTLLAWQRHNTTFCSTIIPDALIWIRLLLCRSGNLRTINDPRAVRDRLAWSKSLEELVFISRQPPTVSQRDDLVLFAIKHEYLNRIVYEQTTTCRIFLLRFGVFLLSIAAEIQWSEVP